MVSTVYLLSIVALAVRASQHSVNGPTGHSNFNDCTHIVLPTVGGPPPSPHYSPIVTTATDSHAALDPFSRSPPTVHTSLHLARAAVRSALQTSGLPDVDIVVCLESGVHILEHPLIFGPRDSTTGSCTAWPTHCPSSSFHHPPLFLSFSVYTATARVCLFEARNNRACCLILPWVGTGKVVWKGRGGNSTVISGGVAVTGWAATTLGGAAVLVAPVPPTAVATGPTGVIRQLWVNGTRASRVKVTNEPNGPVNASSQCTCNLGGPCVPSQRCTPQFPTCVGFVPNKVWGKCTAGGGPGFPSMTGWVSADGATVGFMANTPNDPIIASWAENSSKSIEFTWPIVIKNWIEPRYVCVTHH
jgi:hypothetical protein